MRSVMDVARTFGSGGSFFLIAVMSAGTPQEAERNPADDEFDASQITTLSARICSH